MTFIILTQCSLLFYNALDFTDLQIFDKFLHPFPIQSCLIKLLKEILEEQDN